MSFASCMAFAVAIVALTVAPAVAQERGDGETAAFDAGFGIKLGRTLLLGVEKACPFVREEMDRAVPEDLTLLLTNEHMQRFSRDRCRGSCDLAEMNRNIVECQRNAAIEQCRPFAAIHGGELFELYHDPTGASLSACRK